MEHHETTITDNITNNQTVVNPIKARFSVRITKYHYFIYTILFLSKFPAIWHIFNLILLNPPMTYQCEILGNDTNNTNVCPCSKPIWDRSVFTETVQTRFGLICDKKYEICLSETWAYFGMLIGAFLCGILSDRLGRLVMFCVSFLLIGFAGILVSIAPNMIAFYIFRLFEGAGAGGTIVTGFVLLIEYTGTKYREVVTALYHLPFNAGHMCIAGISYMLRNAFHFQLAISIPPFLVAFAWLCVGESPVWLLDNNHKERAINTMERIAKFNKQPDPTIRSETEAFCSSRTTQHQVKIQIYHIFKYRRLTINFACMSYLYFICGMGYYGVSQYISKMSGDIHVNIVLSAILVMPGTVASALLLNKVGRKPFLASTCLGSGLFMIITVIIPENSAWLKVIFACVSNCCFFMAFIVVFLFGVELFPTQIRNSALGFLSLLSRAGMMAAPQINSLSQTVAGYLFGGMALVGGFLTICLPETRNKELPSTLEEADLRR